MNTEASDSSHSAEARLKVALKWSGVALLVILAVLSSVLWFFSRDQDQIDVAETQVRTPQIASQSTDLPEIRFTDVTEESGLIFEHENGARGERLLPETMGGGLAVFDYDLDSDLDVLFVNSDNWHYEEESKVSSVLFNNNGFGRFTDVTDETIDLTGYGMSPAIGDFNGDRYPDLFVAMVGSNRLFLNREGQSFEDVTETYGVAGTAEDYSSCATFFDYDLDGDLDLFVCNYVGWSAELDIQVDFRLTGVGRAYGPPTDFPGRNSYLYRNDGEQFTDVSASAGIEVLHEQTDLPIGKALAVAVYDVNKDGGPDLFVANDTTRNFLFINQMDGTFSERGIEYGIAFDASGLATGAMGIDVGKFANDERIGIAIGNFANEMSSFYVSPPETDMFSDDAVVAGIGSHTRKSLTFGVLFLDLDNDGRIDLFSANGHIEPEISSVQASQQYKQIPQLFWNCGSECTRIYRDLPSEHTKLNEPLVGRGAAYADIDSDGDLDLIVTQSGGVAKLYQNDLNSQNRSINVSVNYQSPNFWGVGTKVRLILAELVQEREVTRTKSYLSQTNADLHFGIGTENPPYSFDVSWPNGNREIFIVETQKRSVILRYGEGTKIEE